MSRDRRALLVMPILLTAVGAGLVPTAHATATVVRYASPSGVASAHCLKSAPCDLVTAINAAPDGAQVVVEAGSYDRSSPLTTALMDTNGTLDVVGPARGTPAVVYTDASPGIYFSASDISNLTEVASPGSGVGLLDYNGTVSHVSVTALTGGACASYHLLIDSLCLATGDSGTAISLNASTGGPAREDLSTTLRGDTGIATAADGIGLELDASGPATMDAAANNDIFHGGAHDVFVTTTGASALASATISHSDYATTDLVPDVPGSATITADPSDTSAAPEFVNSTAGNFHELASSPTVNTGTKDTAGDTDLDGNLRTSGGTPDMGAYEVLHKPISRRLAVLRRATHSVTVTVTVNAEGLATTLTLRVAGHGHHLPKTVSAGHAAKAARRHVVIHGLKPGTTYSLTVVAHNAAGRSGTVLHTIRTRPRR